MRGDHAAHRDDPVASEAAAVEINVDVIRPLRDNPELEVRKQGGVTTFRVYNYRTLPSGRVVWGDGWTLETLLLLVVACIVLPARSRLEALVKDARWTWLLTGLALLWFLRRARTVVYQSITPLPGLGIQLSTTRGLSLPLAFARRQRTPRTHARYHLPISASSAFVPLAHISTVVINEGLSRWSVRYYLAIVKKHGNGVVVGFDVVRPRGAVLKEVYHGTREILYGEWADDSDDRAQVQADASVT